MIESPVSCTNLNLLCLKSQIVKIVINNRANNINIVRLSVVCCFEFFSSSSVSVAGLIDIASCAILTENRENNTETVTNNFSMGSMFMNYAP